MKVDIISIGDELLIGQVINTNASWMGEQLNNAGFDVREVKAIADIPEAITEALKISEKVVDLVLISGGLGPTKDDRTKDLVCSYFGSELVLHEPSLEHVKSFFDKRGMELTELNRLQAMVPNNCTPIYNAMGTAPGMHFEKEGVHFVFTPGVPAEMKYIMQNYVLPTFAKDQSNHAIVQRTILTHGMGESFLADRIAEWENSLPAHIGLAYLPSPGRVRLRLRAKGEDRIALVREIGEYSYKLHELIPELIYGYDDESMEEVVAEMLKELNFTIATAESCTGGLLGHKLTSVPGSSAYYQGGMVTYSNEAKQNLLGVDADALEKHGAVSEEVVRQMAEGARAKLGTDYALSTSGIAGPDGGSEEKPVGTIWIGLAGPHYTIAKKFVFSTERSRNMQWSYMAALNLLRLELMRKIVQ
jgi:nicotinamide-nucleotide amidase